MLAAMTRASLLTASLVALLAGCAGWQEPSFTATFPPQRGDVNIAALPVPSRPNRARDGGFDRARVSRDRAGQRGIRGAECAGRRLDWWGVLRSSPARPHRSEWQVRGSDSGGHIARRHARLSRRWGPSDAQDPLQPADRAATREGQPDLQLSHVAGARLAQRAGTCHSVSNGKSGAGCASTSSPPASRRRSRSPGSPPETSVA